VKLLEPLYELSYKRGRKLIEDKKYKELVNNRLHKTLGFALNVEVDYESCRTLPGTAIWYSDRPEPKSVIGLRYIEEQGLAGVVYALEAIGKDDLGKEALKEVVDKVVIVVTDKLPAKGDMRKIDNFGLTLENKVFTAVCNLDFTAYVGQSLPYDDMSKKLIRFMEPHFELQFKRQRKQFEDKKYKEMAKRLEGTLKYEMPIEVDFESCRAIKGEAIWYSDKPEPRAVIAVRYLEEQGLAGLVYALEAVGKDELGREALKETFTKIVVHVTGDAPPKSDLRKIQFHTLEKKGNEGHLTHNLDFTQYVGQSFPYSDLKPLIEKMM